MSDQTARQCEASLCKNELFKRLVQRRDDWSNLVERAAIMEYDAGMDRWHAEQHVFEAVVMAVARGEA